MTVLAGSVHEPSHKAGIAHLLEHLLFRGTETQTSAQIQDRIEDLGGNINGQTQIDQTYFHGTVVNADMATALKLLADLVQNPKVDQTDIELEKQIIEDENCRGCFNCSMNEALFEAAYPGGAMSRPVIGYKDTLEGITRDDLLEFHKTFYVGRNISVVVCGDTPHDEVVALAREAFGEIPAGQASTWPRFTYQAGDMHMGTSSEDSGVWMSFDITDLTLAQKRAVYAFSEILGGHGQCLLMEELREKRGLVYSVSTDGETYARRDIIRIYLQGPSARISEICDVAIDTIREAARSLSEAEHAKAIRRHHLNCTMGLDGLEGRAYDMITDMTEKGKVSDPAERYQAYQNMTLSDIRAGGKLLLSLDPCFAISAPLRHAPKAAALRKRLKGKSPGLLGGLLKRAG